jgi:hypothetical protein
LTEPKTERETDAARHNLTEIKKPMNAKLERITPETAAVMLQLNKNNRPVSTRQVKALASEIKEGRWQVNGDTIAFSADRLIDGQHRLMAIIESGIPVTTFVVRGVTSESFLTKDTGKKRRTSDALAISGVINSIAVAAAIKQVWMYSKTGILSNSGLTPSTSVLAEFFEQNSSIVKSVNLVGKKTKLVHNSLLTALHYLFAQKDQLEADQFVNDLIYGANLDPSDPVFMLRCRLVDNFSSTLKLPYYCIGALIIKAWNLRREGKTVKRLVFKSTGEGAEDYPVIK